MSAGALLELHAAAQPFLRGRRHAEAEHRDRFRRALLAVLKERGAPIPVALVETPAEALATLGDVLKRCEALRVNWADIVALVNREYQQEPVHA
jgi:hypothetical protein